MNAQRRLVPLPRRRCTSGRTMTAGLTLVEVMVVVFIMGMIAAVVSKVVVDRLQQAKVELAKTQMAQLAGALDQFYIDNDFYPSTEQGLRALVNEPTSGRTPRNWPEHGYMPSIPKDPWGNEYIYVSPAPDGDYEIICLGRDGTEGGQGYDSDISSRDLAGQTGP